MNYTQEQLEEMDDELLNSIQNDYSNAIVPCNSWSDCGKLIAKLNISNAILKIVEDEVYYDIGSNSYFVVSNKLMRAITIIYILVKQDERV